MKELRKYGHIRRTDDLGRIIIPKEIRQFLNIREKLSLCYYASSSYARSKKILTVSSGIEPKDYDRTLEEILHQLRQVQQAASA